MTTVNNVAKKVCSRWHSMVAGEYTAPPCPPSRVLAELLEKINFAAGFPEEGRYPRFSVTATDGKTVVPSIWRFQKPRPLNVTELRRLIPTTDPHKSAVHAEWTREGQLSIVGIQDLGTSWHRARNGLAYHYKAPATLLVEVERPNRINIYQGPYRVATFSDGEFNEVQGVDLSLFLHAPTKAGLADLFERIKRPSDEPPREYGDFEFIALLNCYGAIANSIAMARHGGTIILLPTSQEAALSLLRMKYAMRIGFLSDAFVSFLNARHESANQYFLRETGAKVDPDAISRLDSVAAAAFDNLVECTRLVARFAECDGALVITRSLEVLGFGCEIVTELRTGVRVREVAREMSKRHRKLDVEQFGMRHRSAVKFASHCRDAVVLVVSQDGPITGVWTDGECVNVRRGVRLVNANLPWA